MATLKAVTKEREATKEGKVNIKIRVTHNRETRYLKTNYYVFKGEFDNNTSRVKKKNQNYEYLNLEIQKEILNYQLKLLKINDIILNKSIDYIIDYLKVKTDDDDFLAAMDEYIALLKKESRDKSASTYQTTRNKLEHYKKHSTLTFQEIDPAFLAKFKNSELTKIRELKSGMKKGIRMNSIALDFRNIRRIFNWKEKYGEGYPFRKFKIESEKTAKRSLAIEQIRSIKNMKLTGKEEYIRDMFILIFYLIGINIKDIYNLVPSDLVQGRIHYKRAKTKRLYSVKVLPEAMAIIHKYKGQKTLLNCSERYSDHNNFMKAIIKYMNKFVSELEISEHVTSYYTRHSWATIASQLDISKDIISHALGHGNSGVTDVYIDFDLKKVDQANELVMKALN